VRRAMRDSGKDYSASIQAVRRRAERAYARRDCRRCVRISPRAFMRNAYDTRLTLLTLPAATPEDCRVDDAPIYAGRDVR
jgi:hypothetical protein